MSKQQVEPKPETTVPLAPPAGAAEPSLARPSWHPARVRDWLSPSWLFEGPGWTWLRVAVDLTMLVLAVAAALVGARAANVPLDAQWTLLTYPGLVVCLLYLRGMYRKRLRLVILDGIAPVVGATSLGAMIIVAFHGFTDSQASAGPLVARAWFFATVYVGGGRVLLALTQRRARARDITGKPTLIVGAGVVGAQIARRLEETLEYGLRPVGFIDADPPSNVQVVDRRAPVLGGPDDLERVAAEVGAQHVILAFSTMPDRALIPLARQCDALGLEVSIVPRLFESINDRIELEHLGGLPLFGLRAVDPQGWQFAVKHAIDRVLGALALLLLSPLMIPIALGVKYGSPGPVLFRQRRVARDGRAFDMLKFRSMRLPSPEDAEFRPESGSAPGGVEGVDRRTRLGRLIRRTSLDELPQLINVLRGEMSLVGPRPERPEFVELFRQDIYRYGDRHRVKSGITGWAQVHGLRGQTSLADRVEWDNYYIENWSLWLDLKIVLLTITAIFKSGEDA